MILNRFLFFILLLLFASCSSHSKSGPSSQRLRFNIHTEPPSLDPRISNDATACAILKMCFEGLTRLNSEGEATLALAEKFTVSSDQKTYRFFLKEATWSDGMPITSYDFEKSWKKILDPAFPSKFSLDLYIIKNARKAKEGECPLSEIGIRSVTEKILEIELQHPAPYLLKMLASHSFLPSPVHITEMFPEWADDAGKHFVCCGPFQIDEWKHHNKIVLKKNLKYWDAPAVKLEEVSLLMIEDENTELAMFDNNELDWAGSPLSSLPIDALESLSKQKQFCRYDMAGTYYYIFNTKVFPFNNLNMRKAFSLAIDRKAIVKHVTQGGQFPATGLVPLTMWKKNISYFKDADVEQARLLFAQALKEMNLSLDQLPDIVLSYNTLQSHHKIAQAIQEQWFNAFGIRVRLENKEWKVFIDEVFRGQFQVARMGGIADFDDPTSFLDNYRYPKGVRNYSNWYDPEFSELLQEAEDSLDAVKRLELLEKAEKLLIDQMPIAPIYFYTGSYLKKPYVEGVFLSHLSDIDFKHGYIDQK